MYWILIVIVFAIITAREMRKERKNPGHRTWTSDGSVKTFHRPGKEKRRNR